MKKARKKIMKMIKILMMEIRYTFNFIFSLLL